MGSLLVYSGITAKVRAMKRNLMTRKEYLEIADFSEVSDVVSFLQRHPGYNELFSGEDAGAIHRGKIEEILNYSLYKDFAKLFSFSGLHIRKYLWLYYMRYEIQLLKKIIRLIFDHREIQIDIAALEPFYTKFSSINLRAAAEANTIDELVMKLKNTEFYAPLIRLNNIKEANLFDYEICLDLFFFTTLWKEKDKFLKGTDLKVITQKYGLKIDLLNIQWIYRAKKYYNVTNSDILAFIIPIKYKLKKSQITSLMEADSVDELIGLIKKTYYGNHLKALESENPEELYRDLIKSFHHKVFRDNPYSMAAVDTYLFLKEDEVRKLITLIECIRYQFDVDQIIKLVVNGGAH